VDRLVVERADLDRPGRHERRGIEPRQAPLGDARQAAGRGVVHPRVAGDGGRGDGEEEPRRAVGEVERAHHAAAGHLRERHVAPALEIAQLHPRPAVLVHRPRQPPPVARERHALHVAPRLVDPAKAAGRDVVVREPGEVALVVGRQVEAAPVRRPLDGTVRRHLPWDEEAVDAAAGEVQQEEVVVGLAAPARQHQRLAVGAPRGDVVVPRALQHHPRRAGRAAVGRHVQHPQVEVAPVALRRGVGDAPAARRPPAEVAERPVGRRQGDFARAVGREEEELRPLVPAAVAPVHDPAPVRAPRGELHAVAEGELPGRQRRAALRHRRHPQLRKPGDGAHVEHRAPVWRDLRAAGAAHVQVARHALARRAGQVELGALGLRHVDGRRRGERVAPLGPRRLRGERRGGQGEGREKGEAGESAHRSLDHVRRVDHGSGVRRAMFSCTLLSPEPFRRPTMESLRVTTCVSLGVTLVLMSVSTSNCPS
jgi:hypothetical protein